MIFTKPVYIAFRVDMYTYINFIYWKFSGPHYCSYSIFTDHNLLYLKDRQFQVSIIVLTIYLQINGLWFPLFLTTSFRFFFSATLPGPSGLSVIAINITTVEARWHPISKEHFLGYNVTLRNYGSNQLVQTLKTNETSIVVGELQPSLQYMLFVQGYTVNETGLSSSFYIYIRKFIHSIEESLQGSKSIIEIMITLKG